MIDQTYIHTDIQTYIQTPSMLNHLANYQLIDQTGLQRAARQGETAVHFFPIFLVLYLKIVKNKRQVETPPHSALLTKFGGLKKKMGATSKETKK